MPSEDIPVAEDNVQTVAINPNTGRPIEDTAGSPVGAPALEADSSVDALVKAVSPMIEKAVTAQVAEADLNPKSKTHIEVNDMPGQVGWHSFGHFMSAIKNAAIGGRADTRLYKASPNDQKALLTKATGDTGELGIVDPTFGGFLVPEDFRAELMRKALDATVFAQRARQVPVSGNGAKIPYVAESTRAGSVHGGIIGYWVDESVAITASAPRFGLLSLVLQKLGFLVYASEELLTDSAVSFQALLPDMFAEAAAWELDNVFIEGSGAGQPLGITNAPCVVSQAAEVGQAANTIVYENITKMYSRMYGPSTRNMIWLVNQDTIPQLLSLSLAVGTGGSSVFVVNASEEFPMTIFGRPVLMHPGCATLGTVGDIIAVDPTQYLLASKVGQGLSPAVATSIHVRFAEDQMAFRFVVRVDGQPWWKSALTPNNGTATQSPIVTLATRS